MSPEDEFKFFVRSIFNSLDVQISFFQMETICRILLEDIYENDLEYALRDIKDKSSRLRNICINQFISEQS